jgi:serine/threonine protein kinase
MQKINDLIGNADEELINNIEDEKNKEFMHSLPKRKGQDLSKILTGASPDAVSLIQAMLQFDPAKRISVEDALSHPFLAKLHAETDEPVEKQTMPPYDFDFELYSLKTSEFKELIYEEIQLYHDEAAVAQYLKNRSEHPNGILY